MDLPTGGTGLVRCRQIFLQTRRREEAERADASILYVYTDDGWSILNNIQRGNARRRWNLRPPPPPPPSNGNNTSYFMYIPI